MATRKKNNNIGAFGHPIYGKGFAKYGEMQPNGSSEIQKDLEEAAEHYASVTDPEAHGIDFIREVFIAGAEWDREQMMKKAVKWLVDDDYDELTDKGRFILGSVGIGYNGYYIPYSDLLKLPKEDEQ